MLLITNHLLLSTFFNKIKLKQLFFTAFIATLLTACGSSDDNDSTGYVKFYHASNNAPEIYFSLDDNTYSSYNFSESSTLYEFESGTLAMELSWREGTNDYQVFTEQDIKVSGEQVELVMISGDINNPEILTFEYENENPDDDEEQFTMRIINMDESSTGIDVYLAKDEQSFNEAILLGSYASKEMSQSHYADLESYKFFITQAGSQEVLYQSADIDFLYTSQYIMVIRANDGPGDSPYTLDVLSKSSATVNFPDKESGAELKIYNALTTHELLPEFKDKIDIYLSGINGEEKIEAIARGEFSEVIDISYGDFAIDITPHEDEQPFAKNHFISVATNSDKSLFFYLTVEEEDDDGDDSTEEKTTVYVNNLPVNNSNRVSLYDHQINVINLVDDFSALDIYFVRSNETVETADYSLRSTRANPQIITLPNNAFDVNILVNQGESELLLAYQQLTLDADSGELFMVIEEDETLSSGYSVKFISQSND